MNLKNHSKLFLSFCVALALSGGGGLVSAEEKPSEAESTGLNDMPVLAEKTGKQVTIEGNGVLNPTDGSAVLYYPGNGQPPTNESGVLYVHDNSMTVSNRTDPTGYSSITGVEVAPSFAPSDDGRVKGIVRIENNGTTVKNSHLPNTAVYAVHDFTDNWNGKDSSSLMAAKNRLTISDHSTVGEVAHITLEGPYLYSQNIIQNNETYVENSTVKGGLYGTLQHYHRPFGSLERLYNTISITDSTVGTGKFGFMGAFTNGSANSFTAKNNKLTFSNSTSHGIYSIQDYVYGTTGYFQNNTLRLEEGAKAYVVVGENFVNSDKNDTKASSIMKDNEVILTGGSTAGYVSAVESGDTNETSQANGNKLIVSDGSTLRFGAAATTTGRAENNRIALENSTAQILIAAQAAGSGSVNNNIVSLSGKANLVSADDLKALDDDQISYGNVGFGSSPVVIAGFTD